MNSTTIGTELLTIGLRLEVRPNYYVSTGFALKGNDDVWRYFADAKELKAWYKDSELHTAYLEYVKEHGKECVKVWERRWNTVA